MNKNFKEDIFTYPSWLPMDDEEVTDLIDPPIISLSTMTLEDANMKVFPNPTSFK